MVVISGLYISLYGCDQWILYLYGCDQIFFFQYVHYIVCMSCYIHFSWLWHLCLCLFYKWQKMVFHLRINIIRNIETETWFEKKIDCKIVHELFVFGMHTGMYLGCYMVLPCSSLLGSLHGISCDVIIFTLDIIVWLKCGHFFYLSVCSPNCVHILLCLKFCVIMVLSPTTFIFEWQRT